MTKRDARARFLATITGAGTAALLLVAGATFAEEPAAGQGAAGTRGADARAEWRQRFDLDGDGRISAEERDAMRAAAFGAADRDGDGLLSEAEMTAVAVERAERRAAERFAAIDANGDDRIDRSEFDEARLARRAKARGAETPPEP